MAAHERIRQYLFASGLDRLGSRRQSLVEKSIHDLIGQLNTPMEVSIDSLYRVSRARCPRMAPAR